MQNAYKEVSKQLLPTVLFLDDHADHFIDNIGRNNWVSLFEEKLLTEVSEILELLIVNYQS